MRFKKRVKYQLRKNVKYFAGHSLGEYSALVASNSLKLDDAIYLLHERGERRCRSQFQLVKAKC